MNAVVAQLTLRGLLGRRRAALLAVLPAVLLALAFVIRAAAGIDEQLAVHLLAAFAAGTLVPLLALIAGTGAIGPEIDDGSIVYLLAKPLRRGSIVLTKLMVAIGVVAVFGAGPVLAAGVVLTGRAGGLAAAFGVGAAVAGVAYAAVFLMLAVLTRHAVVVGLLYAVVWESLIGGFVPGAQALSIQQWALAVTRRVLGDRAETLGLDAAVGLGTGVTLLVVVTVASTWLAARRLRRLRVSTED